MIRDNMRSAVFPDFEKRLPPRAGVGLKPEHFTAILETKPAIGFFEIHAENYFVAGGPFHHYLSRIRENYALSIHGVGLSIGVDGDLDVEHLNKLQGLVHRYEPQSFSEHLAWSTHENVYLNDLLPMPYTTATLNRVCAHIDQVQSHLKRTMLLENPSTYVEFSSSSMSETDFIKEILCRTGCGLLLDVNNVYVSCTNHHRDARAYLAAMPLHKVGEIHLAGFAQEIINDDMVLIDSHDTEVETAVWDLYGETIARMGPVATLLERDGNVPAFEVLLAEAKFAETYFVQQQQATA